MFKKYKHIKSIPVPIIVVVALITISGIVMWYFKGSHLTDTAVAQGANNAAGQTAPSPSASREQTKLPAPPKPSVVAPASFPITVPVQPSVIAGASAAPAPAQSSILFVDMSSSSVTASQAWMAAHGSDAGLERINALPAAHWFGDWNANVQMDVNAYVSAAESAGKIPVLVAYNLPNRDCGGQSAGGSANASTYAAWIGQFAAGIGHRATIVVVEPDSVAASCFDEGRAAMLSAAITTLATTTKSSVYLDSGNANWLSASTMAGRLQQANIAHATGFSLNVSNFFTTTASVAFGNSLSQLIGGKHYVVDTSRNGNGPTTDFQWCNPGGRALGEAPSLQTGTTLADGFLWIKTPGESDGACGPTEAGTNPPAAGTWWPEYAVMLARNKGW